MNYYANAHMMHTFCHFLLQWCKTKMQTVLNNAQCAYTLDGMTHGRGTSSGADGCKPPFLLGNAQCAARRLKRGPFHIGDLVLTCRPQTPKGHSPYAGPFHMVKVIGHYLYLLSDGQKWNTWLLKCYLPPTATWTELLGLPDAEGNQEGHRDAVDALEKGDEGHRYPDRDRRPPDRYTPEDFRQKKTRMKTQVSS